VFWKPEHLREGGGRRRRLDGPPQRVHRRERILVALLKRGVQSIVFTKARVVAELIYRTRASGLAQRVGRLANLLSPLSRWISPPGASRHRAAVFSRADLRGVISTKRAGILGDRRRHARRFDPGWIPKHHRSHVARAGGALAGTESRRLLAVVVAYEDPVDQYLIAASGVFLRAVLSTEPVLDPENPYVLAGRKLSARPYELPLSARRTRRFRRARARGSRRSFEDEGSFKVRSTACGGYCSSSDFYPGRQREFLRTIFPTDTVSRFSTNAG